MAYGDLKEVNLCESGNLLTFKATLFRLQNSHYPDVSPVSPEVIGTDHIEKVATTQGKSWVRVGAAFSFG